MKWSHWHHSGSQAPLEPVAQEGTTPATAKAARGSAWLWAVVGVLISLIVGVGGVAAGAGAKAPPKAVRTWLRQHDAVFLSLQTDLTAISRATGNGNTTALTQACDQLSVDVATAARLPAIPEASLERHWRTALSDFRRGAADCVHGIVENQPRLEEDYPPLLRSGIAQVDELLGVIRKS